MIKKMGSRKAKRRRARRDRKNLGRRLARDPEYDDPVLVSPPTPLRIQCKNPRKSVVTVTHVPKVITQTEKSKEEAPEFLVDGWLKIEKIPVVAPAPVTTSFFKRWFG